LCRSNALDQVQYRCLSFLSDMRLSRALAVSTLSKLLDSDQKWEFLSTTHRCATRETLALDLSLINLVFATKDC